MWNWKVEVESLVVMMKAFRASGKILTDKLILLKLMLLVTSLRHEHLPKAFHVQTRLSGYYHIPTGSVTTRSLWRPQQSMVPLAAAIEEGPFLVSSSRVTVQQIVPPRRLSR